MAAVNRVTLLGHLGRDPELRYTQQGTAVANFSIAVTERFKSREGDTRERTEWVRIVAWGAIAEACKQYLAKGSQVYLEGRLQTREWENKDGAKQRTTEVVAMNVQFLGRPKGSGGEEPPPADDADIPF